jgi:hypothetical protein
MMVKAVAPIVALYTKQNSWRSAMVPLMAPGVPETASPRFRERWCQEEREREI